MNPFTFGNPIKQPERFIGRKAEIRQIANRLLSSAHESTSVIGERRIGKTSLLSHVAHPEVSASLGLTPDKFCLVYVDFQGLTDITPARFWQRVLAKAARSVCDESLRSAFNSLSGRSAFDLFDLEDVFQSAMDRGLTIVLLLDEFEYVTENPNFRSDFFGGLRALAIHCGVALVTATRRELVELCHSEEIKGSPFFNIFANVVLRPFSRDEVEEMLTCYTGAPPEGMPAAQRDLVWHLAGGLPLFTQIAGYYLEEGRQEGRTADQLREYALANFEQQAASHYAYLWSHCTESEKITLLMILTLNQQKKQSSKAVPNAENLARLHPRAAQDLAALLKRGLVEDRAGVFVLSSAPMTRWIGREIMAAPGEEESQQSADEWLKSGGHKDLKDAGSALPKFKKKYWPILGDIAKELSFEFVAGGAIELIKLAF